MSDRSTKVRDLQSLLQISRAMIAESDLDNLLDLIMEETTRLLNAERSTLFLYDEDNHQLFSRIAQKSEIKEIRVEMGEGVAGSVAETRELVNIEDAYEDPRFNAEVDQETGFSTDTILCTPLMNTEDELVGVLQVLNKNDGVFTTYDEELISGLAANAAVALENARLLRHYEEKQKIQQALNIARRIQQDLLPEDAPELNGYQLAGSSIPADETGGDYYDFLQLPDGNTGLVLMDVTGHGVGPAILMATVRSTLHTLVNEYKNPAAVLERANQLLFEDMSADRFATGCIFSLNPDERKLFYASAGHDPPFLFSPDGENVTRLDSTGLPVGMMEQAEYDNVGPITLKPGQKLVLYTDGFTEAMNEEHEELGEEGFLDLIRSSFEKEPETMLDTLKEEVEAYRDGETHTDDLTAIVLDVGDVDVS